MSDPTHPPSRPAGQGGVLPEPDARERRRSEALQATLRARMAASGGVLGFDEFMQLALYDPGHGYYSCKPSLLGEQGDFVTAPELGAVFAQCLARALAGVLRGVQAPTVLEFGAGSGRLAVDLLTELARLDALPGRYLVLEPSGTLRALQRQHAEQQLEPALRARLHWLERLPDAFQGVVLANEVCDAMPVTLLVKRGGQLRERVVCWRDGGFAWAERALDPALAEAAHRRLGTLPAAWPEGYCTELCLRVRPWLATAAGLLERGVLWLIDYGCSRAEYYRAERSAGTLLCHYRHRATAEPLSRVGLQDITAYVDFTHLAESALELGLRVAGYAPQAHFLMASGIDEVLAAHLESGSVAWARLSQQVQRLMLPGEMGERFKVMALARGWDGPVDGFGFRDHRDRL